MTAPPRRPGPPHAPAATLPAWTWLLGPAWAALALAAGWWARREVGDGAYGLLPAAAAYGGALGLVTVARARDRGARVLSGAWRVTWSGLATVSVGAAGYLATVGGTWVLGWLAPLPMLPAIALGWAVVVPVAALVGVSATAGSRLADMRRERQGI